MRLNIRRWLFLGFSLRALNALWNGFFGPSIAADGDAASFHYWAVQYAVESFGREFNIGSSPYITALGMFYYVTTDSLFLGSLLSCIAWLLSALIFLSCLRLVSVQSVVQSKMVMIYAFLPSSIIYTSITIREAYQMLFVNIAIYAALKIFIHKSARHWLALILATACAGMLHTGLMAFGVIFFATTIVFVFMSRQDEKSLLTKGVVVIISFAILSYGYSILGDHFSGSTYNFEAGPESAIRQYQENLAAVDARTNYRSEVGISGLKDLITVIPIGLFQYMFEPLPWHISGLQDVILLFENIVRGWLLLIIWKAFRISTLPKKNVLRFTFFSYLIMETIWSLGTGNWGTSVRHHLPALGLLLIAFCIASIETPSSKNSTFRKR